MARDTDQPQFSNYREAFCAYYRCSDEAFERKVFWKTVYRHALLLAVPIWIFNRKFFHKDFDLIRAFGQSQGSKEFGVAAGEFATVNRMESSIRRGFMRIRVSGTRIKALQNRLSPYVTHQRRESRESFMPRAAAFDGITSTRAERRERMEGAGANSSGVGAEGGNSLAGGAGSSGTSTGAAGAATAGRRSEGGAMSVRRLKQAHEGITSGRGLDEVLQTTGLSRARLMEDLAEYGAGHPEFSWLREYLKGEARREALESENAQLKRELEQRQRENEALRKGAPVSSGGVAGGGAD